LLPARASPVCQESEASPRRGGKLIKLRPCLPVRPPAPYRCARDETHCMLKTWSGTDDHVPAQDRHCVGRNSDKQRLGEEKRNEEEEKEEGEGKGKEEEEEGWGERDKSSN